MAIGISAALPLEYDSLDGPYRLTKTIREAIIQNFKNLILTNPGERMMDPDFGVGIKQYLFELGAIEIQSEIIANIREQTRKYLNTVKVLDIKFTSGSSHREDMITIINSNAMYLQILFTIGVSGPVDVLTLPITQDQGGA